MKMQLLLVAALVGAVVASPQLAFAQGQNGSKPTSSSTDYTVGKPTQKVTPREMKETVRPDGKTSIVTGQTRNENGKIVGPHSHSVINEGEVEYSRTAGGRVVGGSLPPAEGAGGGAGGESTRMPPSGGGGHANDSE